MNVITLTLAPAFDVHCYIRDFLPYHENAATLISRDAGGKGINISRALTANGVKNTAAAILGKENAKEFKDALMLEGLDLVGVTADGRIRENITIHTETKGETRVSFEGFTGSDELLFELEGSLEKELAEGSFLVLAGRLPSGISKCVVKDFLLRVKARGAKIIIDSKSFTIDDLKDIRPFLIKPNEEEIFELFGLNYAGFDEAVSLAEKLHTCGVENVMLTFGGEGAMLINEDGMLRAHAPKITPVSTIGAGDSAIAGFLAIAASGGSRKDALVSAIAYGTAACLTEGTKPPRKESIEELIKRVIVNKG